MTSVESHVLDQRIDSSALHPTFLLTSPMDAYAVLY